MTNFEAFDKNYLKKLIDQFVPGMSEHITPISYLAYTPDIFMFLFRTTGSNGQDYYFVTFQYDYLADPNDANDIVEGWLGVRPTNGIPTAETAELDNQQFVSENDEVYKCLLLQVPRPKNLGYWSDNIVVRKGDDVDVILKDFSNEQRKKVKELLAVGSKDREIGVYKLNGDMELFYSA